MAAELSFVPGAFDAPEAVRRMGGDRVDAVLYFGGPPEALAFARGASRGEEAGRRSSPRPPWSGTPCARRRRDSCGGCYLAAPLAPPDEGTAEMAEFRRIREKYSVGDRHRSFQLLAYAGAVLLEEGLRRSGKGVTREKLVGAIGNVWKLQTGVTPPLTYNANRRTGAQGAAIVRVDPDTGRFVTVDGVAGTAVTGIRASPNPGRAGDVQRAAGHAPSGRVIGHDGKDDAARCPPGSSPRWLLAAVLVPVPADSPGRRRRSAALAEKEVKSGPVHVRLPRTSSSWTRTGRRCASRPRRWGTRSW